MLDLQLIENPADDPLVVRRAECARVGNRIQCHNCPRELHIVIEHERHREPESLCAQHKHYDRARKQCSRTIQRRFREVSDTEPLSADQLHPFCFGDFERCQREINCRCATDSTPHVGHDEEHPHRWEWYCERNGCGAQALMPDPLSPVFEIQMMYHPCIFYF
jgi:hypothetical protein